ncbi:MAG TPA: response regulator transcription factor [Anaerolineae bacterium]|nr:response regulator transcription factor [Anaerolineae bacterium]
MRILLADGRSKVRYALRVLLEGQQGLEVVAEAVNAEDLIVKVRESCPDVVLIDWDLPGLNRTRTLENLRKDHPGIRVIAMSGRPEAGQAALDAGVDSFIHKTSPPDLLLAVINKWEQVSK